MRNIFIDTSGTPEQLEALECLCRDEGINVTGVSVAASGEKESAEEIAEKIMRHLSQIGRPDIQVYRGADNAVWLPYERRNEKSSVLSASEETATKALIKAAERTDELAALGPLTNVALALAKKRTAMAGVKKIWMLSGMVFHGDAGPMSERSVTSDPAAADNVLKSGISIVILPIECGSLKERAELVLHPEKISRTIPSYTRIELNGGITYAASINDVRSRGRKEFISQNTVMQPYNCETVMNNWKEEISMEVDL